VDITIEALSRHRELVPVVAQWHFDEWGHTDPGGSAAGWAAGLARQADADQVPGTLIALSGGRPLSRAGSSASAANRGRAGPSRRTGSRR
jgi:hypothetical protein